jgi:hypothetical protein
MHRVLLAFGLALTMSACAYRPTPDELVRINDSPADMNACRRLGIVSPTVPTVPGVDTAYWEMLNKTVALGGTDLLLQKRSRDWLLIRGVAYRCPELSPDRYHRTIG